MKTLILVRHAKSDWPEDTDDFDRPLADKGIHDAENMAEHLKKESIIIDRFLSSPALRAFTTCQLFNEVYKVPVETLQQLYNASESVFENLITEIPDGFNSVAMFSHNNGISNFANSMSEQVFMMPTCGVAGFEIDCDSWSEFHDATKRLAFFYEPKKI